MSTDLTRNQLFFKGTLSDRISNPSKNNEYSVPFGLNLINYDLFDEDVQKITNLIILTDKFNSLNIRLSDTLTDSNTLSKLLRKISLKRQFTSLGFYIKYLDESLLTVFLDFHLNYLLLGMILLVLDSQHPQELALESTNKK